MASLKSLIVKEKSIIPKPNVNKFGLLAAFHSFDTPSFKSELKIPQRLVEL